MKDPFLHNSNILALFFIICVALSQSFGSNLSVGTAWADTTVFFATSTEPNPQIITTLDPFVLPLEEPPGSLISHFVNATGETFTDFHFDLRATGRGTQDYFGGPFFDEIEVVVSPSGIPERVWFFADQSGGIPPGTQFTIGLGGTYEFIFDPDSPVIATPSIPEPSTALLLGTGMLGLLFWQWKQARGRKS